jgi:hypothetical protein
VFELTRAAARCASFVAETVVRRPIEDGRASRRAPALELRSSSRSAQRTASWRDGYRSRAAMDIDARVVLGQTHVSRPLPNAAPSGDVTSPVRRQEAESPQIRPLRAWMNALRRQTSAELVANTTVAPISPRPVGNRPRVDTSALGPPGGCPPRSRVRPARRSPCLDMRPVRPRHVGACLRCGRLKHVSVQISLRPDSGRSDHQRIDDRRAHPTLVAKRAPRDRLAAANVSDARRIRPRPWGNRPRPATLPSVPSDERLSQTVDQFSVSGHNHSDLKGWRGDSGADGAELDWLT